MNSYKERKPQSTQNVVENKDNETQYVQIKANYGVDCIPPIPKPKDDVRESCKKEIKKIFQTASDSLKMLRENDSGLLIDMRAVAIAITNLDTAKMWAVASLYSEDERNEH